MLQSHYLRGTGQYTLAALDAVGVQIACGLTTTVVGRKLHGTDTGAALALHLAGTGHMDVCERLGLWRLLWSHPA